MSGENPTREDVSAVLTFSRSLLEPGFVAGEWVSPPSFEDGVLTLASWLPSEEASQWERALYEHHIILSFDWAESTWTRQMGRYYADPSLLERVSLLTIRKVLTTLLRADRFCEGYLADAFERGVPQSATMRLVQSAEKDIDPARQRRQDAGRPGNQSSYRTRRS